MKSPCFSEQWNRGHLAPSYIMSYSKEAWEDTYFITNVAMQAGHFNQQPWEHVEHAVAEWIKSKNRGIYIVTGTLFDNRKTPTATCEIGTGKMTGIDSSSEASKSESSSTELSSSSKLVLKKILDLIK